MDANHKRYLREFFPAMLAYAVMVIVSVWLIKHKVYPSLRLLFAILPLIPVWFAMWAATRYVRGLDELRIQFEGLAFSFLVTCMIAFTWGLLQSAGLPQADNIWVAPLLIFLWGIGACVAKRRYQ